MSSRKRPRLQQASISTSTTNSPSFSYSKQSVIKRIHSNICVIPSFASSNICKEFIQICELTNAFTNSDPKYAQSTTDLEVDQHPTVRRFLRQRQLVNNIRNAMMDTHKQILSGFDDLFVVKYDATAAGGQKELIKHFDGGNVSFMLALSSRSDYKGGGTRFDCLKVEEGSLDHDILHLNQGDVVLFDADLYHQGLVITHGLRYLLVGFCFTGIWGVKLKPGHVDLSLRLSLNQGTEQIKQEKKKKKRKKRKKNKTNEEQNN
jgi:hypothetical protein